MSQVKVRLIDVFRDSFGASTPIYDDMTDRQWFAKFKQGKIKPTKGSIWDDIKQGVGGALGMGDDRDSIINPTNPQTGQAYTDAEHFDMLTRPLDASRVPQSAYFRDWSQDDSHSITRELRKQNPAYANLSPRSIAYNEYNANRQKYADMGYDWDVASVLLTEDAQGDFARGAKALGLDEGEMFNQSYVSKFFAGVEQSSHDIGTGAKQAAHALFTGEYSDDMDEEEKAEWLRQNKIFYGRMELRRHYLDKLGEHRQSVNAPNPFQDAFQEEGTGGMLWQFGKTAVTRFDEVAKWTADEAGALLTYVVPLLIPGGATPFTVAWGGSAASEVGDVQGRGKTDFHRAQSEQRQALSEGESREEAAGSFRDFEDLTLWDQTKGQAAAWISRFGFQLAFGKATMGSPKLAAKIKKRFAGKNPTLGRKAVVDTMARGANILRGGAIMGAEQGVSGGLYEAIVQSQQAGQTWGEYARKILEAGLMEGVALAPVGAVGGAYTGAGKFDEQVDESGIVGQGGAQPAPPGGPDGSDSSFNFGTQARTDNTPAWGGAVGGRLFNRMSQADNLSQQDKDSPYDNETLRRGRRQEASDSGVAELDAVLDEQGLPPIGTIFEVEQRNGDVIAAEIVDVKESGTIGIRIGEKTEFVPPEILRSRMGNIIGKREKPKTPEEQAEAQVRGQQQTQIADKYSQIQETYRGTPQAEEAFLDTVQGQVDKIAPGKQVHELPPKVANEILKTAKYRADFVKKQAEATKKAQDKVQGDKQAADDKVKKQEQGNQKKMKDDLDKKDEAKRKKQEQEDAERADKSRFDADLEETRTAEKNTGYTKAFNRALREELGHLGLGAGEGTVQSKLDRVPPKERKKLLTRVRAKVKQYQQERDRKRKEDGKKPLTPKKTKPAPKKTAPKETTEKKTEKTESKPKDKPAPKKTEKKAETKPKARHGETKSDGRRSGEQIGMDKYNQSKAGQDKASGVETKTDPIRKRVQKKLWDAKRRFKSESVRADFQRQLNKIVLEETRGKRRDIYALDEETANDIIERVEAETAAMYPADYANTRSDAPKSSQKKKTDKKVSDKPKKEKAPQKDEELPDGEAEIPLRGTNEQITDGIAAKIESGHQRGLFKARLTNIVKKFLRDNGIDARENIPQKIFLALALKAMRQAKVKITSWLQEQAGVTAQQARGEPPTDTTTEEETETEEEDKPKQGPKKRKSGGLTQSQKQDARRAFNEKMPGKVLYQYGEDGDYSDVWAMTNKTGGKALVRILKQTSDGENGQYLFVKTVSGDYGIVRKRKSTHRNIQVVVGWQLVNAMREYGGTWDLGRPDSDIIDAIEEKHGKSPNFYDLTADEAIEWVKYEWDIVQHMREEYFSFQVVGVVWDSDERAQMIELSGSSEKQIDAIAKKQGVSWEQALIRIAERGNKISRKDANKITEQIRDAIKQRDQMWGKKDTSMDTIFLHEYYMAQQREAEITPEMKKKQEDIDFVRRTFTDKQIQRIEDIMFNMYKKGYPGGDSPQNRKRMRIIFGGPNADLDVVGKAMRRRKLPVTKAQILEYIKAHKEWAIEQLKLEKKERRQMREESDRIKKQREAKKEEKKAQKAEQRKEHGEVHPGTGLPQKWFTKQARMEIANAARKVLQVVRDTLGREAMSGTVHLTDELGRLKFTTALRGGTLVGSKDKYADSPDYWLMRVVDGEMTVGDLAKAVIDNQKWRNQFTSQHEAMEDLAIGMGEFPTTADLKAITKQGVKREDAYMTWLNRYTEKITRISEARQIVEKVLEQRMTSENIINTRGHISFDEFMVYWKQANNFRDIATAEQDLVEKVLEDGADAIPPIEDLIAAYNQKTPLETQLDEEFDTDQVADGQADKKKPTKKKKTPKPKKQKAKKQEGVTDEQKGELQAIEQLLKNDDFLNGAREEVIKQMKERRQVLKKKMTKRKNLSVGRLFSLMRRVLHQNKEIVELDDSERQTWLRQVADAIMEIKLSRFSGVRFSQNALQAMRDQSITEAETLLDQHLDKSEYFKTAEEMANDIRSAASKLESVWDRVARSLGVKGKVKMEVTFDKDMGWVAAYQSGRINLNFLAFLARGKPSDARYYFTHEVLHFLTEANPDFRKQLRKMAELLRKTHPEHATQVEQLYRQHYTERQKDISKEELDFLIDEEIVANIGVANMLEHRVGKDTRQAASFIQQVADRIKQVMLALSGWKDKDGNPAKTQLQVMHESAVFLMKMRMGHFGMDAEVPTEYQRALSDIEQDILDIEGQQPGDIEGPPPAYEKVDKRRYMKDFDTVYQQIREKMGNREAYNAMRRLLRQYSVRAGSGTLQKKVGSVPKPNRGHFMAKVRALLQDGEAGESKKALSGRRRAKTPSLQQLRETNERVEKGEREFWKDVNETIEKRDKWENFAKEPMLSMGREQVKRFVRKQSHRDKGQSRKDYYMRKIAFFARLARTRYIMRFHPGVTLANAIGRKDLADDIRIINGSASVAQAAFVYHVPRVVRDEDGRITGLRFDRNTRGGFLALRLIDGMDPDYVKKAIRYMQIKYGNPTNIGKQSASKILAWGDKHPRVRKFAQEWKKYKEKMLDFYVDLGYISKAQAEQFRRDGVPLTTPIHQQVGGIGMAADELFTGDHVDALVGSLYRDIKKAMSVTAMVNLLENVKKSEIGDLVMKDITNNKGRIPSQQGRVVRFQVAGELKKYVIYDDATLEMIKSLTPSDMGKVWDTLLMGKNVISATATVDPTFGVRNWVRDFLNAHIIAKPWTVPFVTSAEGVYHTLRESEVYKDWLLQGGGFVGRFHLESNPDVAHHIAGDASAEDEQKRRSFRQRMGPVFSPQDWRNRPAHAAGVKLRALWRYLSYFSRSLETGTRVGVYKAGVKQGMTKRQAAVQARKTTDFANVGTDRGIVYMILQTIPFAISSINGMDAVWQAWLTQNGQFNSFKDVYRTPTGKRILTRAAALMLLSVALWLWNVGDEERKKQYEQLNKYEKTTHLHIFGTRSPFRDDDHIKIPVPFQVGQLFMILPQLALDEMAGLDTVEGTTRAMFEAMVLIGHIPGLLSPFYNTAVNEDFFGERVIPPHMMDFPAHMQYHENTPGVYKWIARQFKHVGMEVSPLKWQEVMQGYGTNLLRTVESGIRDATWKRNEENWGENPNPRFWYYATGAAALVAEDEPRFTKTSSQFWELRKMSVGMLSSLSRNIKHSNSPKRQENLLQFQYEYASGLQAAKLVRDSWSTLKAYREMGKQIKHDKNLSAEQKRQQLRKIYAEERKLQRFYLDNFGEDIKEAYRNLNH